MSVNKDTQERLELALSKHGISQNKAAKDIGYSPSALSEYRQNKYNGNTEALEEAILKWLGRMAQAHARMKVPIIQTDALKKINNAINIAHAECDIALITDDAGGGKSTAAKHYVAQNPRTTVYIEVIAGMNRKAMLLEIAEKMGIETYRVSQPSLIKTIADTLSDKNMVVILDEADYLKADALEFSRRLVNDIGRSGLVLIGLPRLRAVIQNLKSDHRQLESRIGVYLPLSGLTKKDAKLLAQNVWPEVHKDVVEAMYEISKTDIRQYTKIIERTQQVMVLNTITEPDIDAVEVAAQMIMRRNRR